MTTSTKSADMLLPFNPTAWLDRYVELGGGYSVVADAIWLHWLINSNVDEAAIKAHDRVLRGRPERRDAVKAVILQRVALEVAE